MKFHSYKIIYLLIFIFSAGFVSGASIFNSPREILFPSAQLAIASADLNSDGIPDLILGGDAVFPEPGKIRVGLGVGNGNFKNWQEYEIGYNPNHPRALVVEEIRVADFNNDGNLDVVATHNRIRSQLNSSPLLATVLFGNGQGALEPAESYVFFDATADNLVNTMTIADLNRDGLQDIILGLFWDNLGKLYFMKNLGNGNFTVIGPKVVGGRVTGIDTALINNDQHIDVIFSTLEGIGILYMDGNFFSTTGAEVDSGFSEGEIVVDDFNSDGKADLAVADFFNPRVRVFVQTGKGFPAAPAIYNTSVRPDRFKSLDFNHDGKRDLILGDGLNGGLRVLYGNGQGEFAEGEQIQNTALSDFAVDDFDQNGKMDIITAHYNQSASVQAKIFMNAPNPKRYLADFDGDKKIDVSIYRPSAGQWWYLQSSNYQNRAFQFGESSDVIAPADYTGDGKTDVAFWRPSTGEWFILRSENYSYYAVPFGQNGDIPAPGDFDNDGKADLAVFRPDTGLWFIQQSSGGIIIQQFGIKGDKPVTADYDGDGRADVAIWRRSTGEWWLNRSAAGVIAFQFGSAADVPVSADYTGDGRTDVAVFRPQNGFWFVLRSENLSYYAVPFGLKGDIPVTGDYDGDGKADFAVFRPNDRIWYLQASKDGFSAWRFGLASDQPIPAAN